MLKESEFLFIFLINFLPLTPSIIYSSWSRAYLIYLSKIWDLISKETDTYLIDDMFYPENYGTLSINDEGEVSIELKDLDGVTVGSTKLKIRGN